MYTFETSDEIFHFSIMQKELDNGKQDFELGFCGFKVTKCVPEFHIYQHLYTSAQSAFHINVPGLDGQCSKNIL